MNSKNKTVIQTKNLNENFPEVPDNVHSTVLNTLENMENMEVYESKPTMRRNKHYKHAAAIVAAIGVFTIVSISGYAAYRHMTKLQIQQFVKNLTRENINAYLELDESSVRISAPDANGMYEFTWKDSESYESLDAYDLKIGELYVKGYGSSDTGLGYERLDYVKTITLNRDGTVTYAVYMPRQD